MSATSQRALLVLSAAALAAALLWWFAPAKVPTRAPERAEPAQVVRASVGAPGRPIEVMVAGISGTVRDLDGAPLAGAYVCAWRLGPALPGERGMPLCTEAGADGFYALTGLPPLLHAIHAGAPRHRPARLEPDVTLRPGERRGGVDLALAPGGVRVEGIVQDLSGGIVEGAWVTSGDGRGPGTAATRSDGAGRFALWVRPGSTRLLAQAEGYADASDHGSAPGQGFVLLLTPEAVLVGEVVTSETRAPVAGARVTVVAELAEGGATQVHAFTDASGRFRLAPLQPGLYKPSAQAQGRDGEAERSVRLGLGETSDPLTIVVHPVATLSGRVAVHGGPGGCPRGEVHLTSRTGSQPLVEAVDASGAVTFMAVRPGAYEVRVVCPGYVVPGGFPPVVVARASVSGLVWEVQTGKTIRGRVVDARGRGVAGLSVTARPEQPMHSAGSDDGTDVAGRFEVAGLSPGTYQLQLAGEGLHAPPQPVTVALTAARDADDVELVIGSHGELRGVVVDDRGEPVSRVHVEVHGPEGLTTGTTSTGDGTFLLVGLPPGDYRLRGRRSGVAAVLVDAPEEDEVAARVVEDGSTEVRLVVDGADEQIRGRVLYADGGPVSDAFVIAVREQPGMDPQLELRWGGLDRPVLTDADGVFTLHGLLAGDHALRAYRRGGGEALAEHVAAGTTTTLTIAATAEVGGTIAGPAPDELAVCIVDTATKVERVEEFYRSEGRWGFTGLPAGTYELFFESTLGTARQTITLRPDEQRSEMRVALSPAGRIRGQVVDAATGAAVAGMQVVASPMEGRTRLTSASAPVTSDADGRFEIGGVRVGLSNLSVHGAGQGAEVQLTVESERSVAVTVPVVVAAQE